jgi:hypothetical protein
MFSQLKLFHDALRGLIAASQRADRDLSAEQQQPARITHVVDAHVLYCYGRPSRDAAATVRVELALRIPHPGGEAYVTVDSSLPAALFDEVVRTRRARVRVAYFSPCLPGHVRVLGAKD